MEREAIDVSLARGRTRGYPQRRARRRMGRFQRKLRRRRRRTMEPRSRRTRSPRRRVHRRRGRPVPKRRRRPGRMERSASVPGAGAKREPARPAGRGFSMGRGRGAAGFGGAGVGAGVGASAAGFLDGLPRRAPPRVKDGQGFVSALSGGIPPAPNFADAPVRHGPVRYKYSANDLLGRLGQLRAATGGTLPLPSAVDPDSVPLRTVKPAIRCGNSPWRARERRAPGASGSARAASARHPRRHRAARLRRRRRSGRSSRRAR